MAVGGISNGAPVSDSAYTPASQPKRQRPDYCLRDRYGELDIFDPSCRVRSKSDLRLFNFPLSEVGFGFTHGEPLVVQGKEYESGGLHLDAEKAIWQSMWLSLSAIGSAELSGGTGPHNHGGAGLVQTGAGLKLQLGAGEAVNVYGTVMGTANALVSDKGASVGVGHREAIGGEMLMLFGEVASDNSTNMHALTTVIGFRIHEGTL